MDTRFRLYLLGLVVLLGLYAVAESQRPTPVNWHRTYQSRDRIPFGTYALVELLPDVFGPDADVTVTREPVYNRLWQAEEDPVSRALTMAHDVPTNYVFVSPAVALDSLDLEALLTYATDGGHVFIAADELPANLLRRLHLVQRSYDAVSIAAKDSVRLLFAGDSTGRAYRFGSRDVSAHLRQQGPDYDSTLTTLAADPAGRAVLVRAATGAGSVTLCSVPVAFTNYFVLHTRSADFAWRALSALPRGAVWWDEYQKQGRDHNESLLRVVMKHPALRVAFWLLLGGGLLLLLVNGRRRQRPIPVVKPLPNNTLQFVHTVAGLYRQGDNHAAIAPRKIDLFLDHLRTRYRAPTDDLGADSFRELLAHKLALPRADVDELLRRLDGLRQSGYASDGELLWLSRTLSELRKR